MATLKALPACLYVLNKSSVGPGVLLTMTIWSRGSSRANMMSQTKATPLTPTPLTPGPGDSFGVRVVMGQSGFRSAPGLTKTPCPKVGQFSLED